MRQIKRAIKVVIGFTLLAIGVVLLVTPGPGWLVILSGLAVLAAEFLWARRLLDRLKNSADRVVGALRPGNDPS
ncbi:MAG TPA: PGPGW domain-containing protein [Patescibacteria group bacterium]|nr:PGPGW domain-containing protein [Patescibacteria group bacterium]